MTSSAYCVTVVIYCNHHQMVNYRSRCDQTNFEAPSPGRQSPVPTTVHSRDLIHLSLQAVGISGSQFSQNRYLLQHVQLFKLTTTSRSRCHIKARWLAYSASIIHETAKTCNSKLIKFIDCGNSRDRPSIVFRWEMDWPTHCTHLNI